MIEEATPENRADWIRLAARQLIAAIEEGGEVRARINDLERALQASDLPVSASQPPPTSTDADFYRHRCAMLEQVLKAHGLEHPYSAPPAPLRDPDDIHAFIEGPAAPPAPAKITIVQGWFCALGMTKAQTHKRLNWDDCERLLRLLDGKER